MQPLLAQAILTQMQAYVKKPYWKDKGYSEEFLKKYIDTNIAIIGDDPGNIVLSKTLKNFSERIKKEFETPEGHELSRNIQELANEVLKLPIEIWTKILLHTASEKETKVGFAGQMQKCVTVSQLLSNAAKLAKRGFKGYSLKNAGYPTPEEAIKYITDNRFLEADLRDYPDLTEAHLKELFEKNPNLRTLAIKSDKITKLPGLPTKLEVFNCDGCRNFKEIQAIQSLKELNCQGTLIEGIPNLENLAKLQISDCLKIKIIPPLPKLKKLWAHSCNSLTEISNLPSLKLLFCFFNENIAKISHLPSLQSLYCGGCKKLTEVSDLPNLKLFECPKCRILPRISNLPLLKRLWCNSCKNLTTIEGVEQLIEIRLDNSPKVTLASFPEGLKEIKCSKNFQIPDEVRAKLEKLEIV